MRTGDVSMLSSVAKQHVSQLAAAAADEDDEDGQCKAVNGDIVERRSVATTHTTHDQCTQQQQQQQQQDSLMSENDVEPSCDWSPVKPEVQCDVTEHDRHFGSSPDLHLIWSIARWLGHDANNDVNQCDVSQCINNDDVTETNIGSDVTIRPSPRRRHPLSTLAARQSPTSGLTPSFSLPVSATGSAVPWRPFVDYLPSSQSIQLPSPIFPVFPPTIVEAFNCFALRKTTTTDENKKTNNEKFAHRKHSKNSKNQGQGQQLSTSGLNVVRQDEDYFRSGIIYTSGFHEQQQKQQRRVARPSSLSVQMTSPEMQQSQQTPAGKHLSCPYCSKSYTSAGALRMHVRTHTLPCRCGVCGKAFSRPWLLHGHQRTHTGERPYSCLVCDRAFADRSNLRAHLQTHDTDSRRRYTCTVCSRSFTRLSLLLKHEETSSGCGGALSRSTSTTSVAMGYHQHHSAAAAAAGAGGSTAAAWVQIPAGFL